MNEAHKGHRILVSASRLATARQWKLYLTIIWNEDGKGMVSKLTVNRTCRLREEAEMDGLLFAKTPDLERSSRTGREGTLDIGASDRSDQVTTGD